MLFISHCFKLILIESPCFFFLFNNLLMSCDTKALLEARANEGIIFLAKSFAYGNTALKISPRLPPCCK